MGILDRLTSILLGPVKSGASGYYHRQLVPLNVERMTGIGDIDDKTAVIIRGNDNPKYISLPEPIAKVRGGIDHIAFLTVKNRLFMLGSNYYGQLGIDINKPTNLWTNFKFGSSGEDEEDFEEPQLLETLDNIRDARIKDIACGHFTTYAVSLDDKICYSWGSGILGNGTDHFDSRPQPVPLRNTVSVDCWRDLVLLSTEDESQYVFGSHRYMKSRILKPVKLDTSLSGLPFAANESPDIPIIYAQTKAAFVGTSLPLEDLKIPLQDERTKDLYINYNYCVFYKKFIA